METKSNGSRNGNNNPSTGGYTACGCRDCMEVAIGAPGTMCHECVTAGCDGGECDAPGAYGGGDEPEAAR